MEEMELLQDETGTGFVEETLPEEPATETEMETDTEPETKDPVQTPEEPAEDLEEQLPEADPVNTISVSGNVIILPEGYEAAAPGGETFAAEDTVLIVEALEYQTEVIHGGFLGLSFLLGLVIGILLIHGFRLRRV